MAIPYLRGKADAFTAWNLLLLGGAIFVGVGGLEVVYGYWHWPELQWFQPTRHEVEKYMLGTVLFYVTLFFAYYGLKWPQKLVGHCFNKWPNQTLTWQVFSLGLCFVLTLLALVFRGTPILSALFGNISQKAAVFAAVISFCFWYRNKTNMAALALFIGVFAYAFLFSMVTFIGRRLLLSVGVAPLFCIYWISWRYRSPKRNLIWITLAGVAALSLAAFYATFRHAGSQNDPRERSFSSIIENIKSTSLDKVVGQATQDWMHFLAQYTTHYSLLTIHLVDEGKTPVEPLNTLAFLVTYPIPRVIFPEKPSPFGLRIVPEVLRLPYATNWGLGIVGHCYHEGGFAVVVLYAFLLVLLVRVLDDALLRQPSNEYLIAILAAAAPHYVSLIRGDPSTMAAEILEAFFFAWGLSLIGRFLVGTAPVVDFSRDLRLPSPRPLM
ncbi:MAG: hypothetical protein AB7G28_23435 [Pirellulales bacterium]